MVTNLFHPDRGGGASVFSDLCYGLAERGHDVTVYAAYPYYDAAPYSYYPSDSGYPDQGNYIQRDMSSGAPPSEPQYQYYCPEPAGYYPQLQSCPKAWLKVVPERSPRPRPQ